VSLRELEKRLQKEPGNLGLKVQVATLLREAGRNAEAVALYFQVAIAYRDGGRKQQAIAVCRSILELAPHDDASRVLLAELTTPPVPVRAPTPEPVAPPAPRLTPDMKSEPAPPPSRPAQLKIPTPVPRAPVVPPEAKTPSPEPKRRSSLDETPLPKPVPYHVIDPTTGQQRLSPSALIDADPTRPDAAQKTREDVAAELDTRPVRKLDSSEVRKISQPIPTVEYPRVDFDDDSRTPVRDSDEITRPQNKLPEKD